MPVIARILPWLPLLLAGRVAAADVHWARVTATEIVVDVLDHPNAGALTDRYFDACADVELPPDEPLLTPPYRVGATWSLVTRDAVFARPVRRVTVLRDSFADHVLVTFDGAPGAAGPALALGPDERPRPDLRLRAPRTRTLAEPADRALLETLRAQLLRAVPAEQQPRASRARVDAAAVTWVEGRFGAGASGLVAVAAVLPGEHPEDPVETLSALLFVDAAGRVVAAVAAPRVGSARHEVLALFDRTGEGRDAVVFETRHAEGYGDFLVEWDGVRATTTTLAGGGAPPP